MTKQKCMHDDKFVDKLHLIDADSAITFRFTSVHFNLYHNGSDVKSDFSVVSVYFRKRHECGRAYTV